MEQCIIVVGDLKKCELDRRARRMSVNRGERVSVMRYRVM